MANDPVIETGPATDGESPEGVFLRGSKQRDRDTQKVDARLREAVAKGDENFVRARLGGDRVLSEAEILLLIKARREAEENVKETMQATQVVEKAELAEEEKENFTAWVRRYVASKAAEAKPEPVFTLSMSEYRLDANGRDPYGETFNANFGYDTQGNYNDSYNGQLNEETGIYRDDKGGEADLRLGIYERDDVITNKQKGLAIVRNETNGTFELMRVDDKGTVIGPAEPPNADGSPKTMTQEDIDRTLQSWRDTNKRLTEAEYRAQCDEIKKNDRDRAELLRRNGNPSAGHAGATDAHDAGTTSTTRASDDVHTEPLAMPDPRRNPGVGMRRDADSIYTQSQEIFRSRDVGATLRNNGATKQRERREARMNGSVPGNNSSSNNTPGDRIGSTLGSNILGSGISTGATVGTTIATGSTPSAIVNISGSTIATRDASGASAYITSDVTEAEKEALLASAANRVAVPKFVLGEASRPVPEGKAWVKDKDGGVWDDKGGYYDKQGGYWDTQGGYFDKDGNYTDQYGGYRLKDGRYMDAKGNWTDMDGNLWLAGNKTGKPDFMKQDGVDYVDVLAKAAENRYGKMKEANPGLSDSDAAALKEKLVQVDKEFVARGAKAIMPEAPSADPQPAPASQSNFLTGTAISTETALVTTVTETAPTTTKRQTSPGPKIGG